MPMPKGFKYSNYERIKLKCTICNKDFTRKPSEVKNGIGKTCSKNCYGKYRSKNFTKNKNSNWKGGNLFDIKKQIRIRDNYTCQICGLKDIDIMQVDHIKPKCIFPEISMAIENLITLCPNCHARKTIRDKKDIQIHKKSIKGVKIWQK